MSVNAFVSTGMRLVASLAKATQRPSAEMDAKELEPSPSLPSEATLTRSVVPFCRSRTKMSMVSFPSPGTRLVASLWKATKRPSAEMDGEELGPNPSEPSEATLTRSVVCI